MLDKLRSNKNNSIITFVVGLIVVVFIFWGSGTSQGQRSQIVATVNGKPITEVQFARAVGNQIEQMRRFSSKSPSKAEELLIQQRVLDQLIERELLKQEARRLDLVVSDYELQKEIIENPYLQDESGKFDLKRYERIRKRMPSFEQEERERLLLTRLQEMVTGSVTVSDADLKSMFERQNTKVNLEYVKLPYSRFGRDVQITAEERAAFLKDHKDEVQARYDQDFNRLYNLPKKVKASHILLKFEEGDTPEAKEQVRQKMKQVQELAKTRDFAELAREYSEDPGSTSRGGDLGYFDEKRMDPAFSRVAFSTPVGQVSDIVESKFGLHLIKVLDVQEAEVKKLEQVQDEIADALLKEQKGPELARKAADKIQAVWTRQGPELEAALKEHNLTIQETGLTTQLGDNIRGIGKSTELANLAFSLRPGSPAPDKVFTVGESLVLVRLKERQEADMAEFEAAKSRLMAQARRQKEQQVLEAWIDSLKARSEIEVELALGAPEQPAS